MKNTAKLICLLGVLTLAACGSDDHQHDDGSAPHAHDGDAHAHNGEGEHEHRGDSHAQEGSETEAFYGDEADSADTEPMKGGIDPANPEEPAASAETHSHGDDEPHTHD